MHKYTQAARQISPDLFRRRIQRRAEAALDFLLALAIGVGLAALLVAWWSS